MPLKLLSQKVLVIALVAKTALFNSLMLILANAWGGKKDENNIEQFRNLKWKNPDKQYVDI